MNPWHTPEMKKTIQAYIDKVTKNPNIRYSWETDKARISNLETQLIASKSTDFDINGILSFGS